MVVTIMQPAYLPWLGFFDRMDASDLCIVLDHVAMDRASKTRFANRNRIRTQQGWAWLTVPVAVHGSPPLCAIPLAGDGSWRARHLASLDHAYPRTRWYREHRPFFQDFYANPMTRLVEAALPPQAYLARALGIDTLVVRSSTLGVAGTKTQMLVNLCLAAKADTYISGPFGRDYLDREAFAANGIGLVFHDYDHPCYVQAFPGFEPYMSAVDLLCNHGPDSKDILVSGRRLNPV